MKATTLLTQFVAVGMHLIGHASAIYCYRTGHVMSTNHLYWHSGRACRGYDGKQGAFQGTFAPNGKKSACVNVGGNHITMEVQNLNPSKSFDLRDEDCVKEFQFIIKDCTSRGFDVSPGGGNTTPSAWYFRCDCKFWMLSRPVLTDLGSIPIKGSASMASLSRHITEISSASCIAKGHPDCEERPMRWMHHEVECTLQDG